MEDPKKYWIALDGLRGVAVLFVLLYHFGASVGSGGYLGVDVFFVISGCVVAASLRRSLARGQTIWEFFQRRAARLLPNLVALLVVVLVWDTWHEHRLLTANNAAVLAGFAQISNLVPNGGMATPHLWSLSEEWQFYMALPLLLPFLCVCGPGWAASGAIGLAVASVLSRPIMRLMFGATVGHAYLWPFARLDGLMLGVAAALLVECGHRFSNRLGPLAASALLILLMLFAPRWYSEPDVSLFYVMPAASTAAFAVVWAMASLESPSLLSRGLSLPILRYLGERSYSLYLWHYLVGVAVIGQGEVWRGPWTFVRQVVLSVVVAIAAYETVEKPARRHFNRLIASRRFRHRPQRPTLAASTG